MNKTDPPTKFQFSIARMLVVTAAVAIVFGAFKASGSFRNFATIIPATLIAVAAGGMVMIWGRQDLSVGLPYVFVLIFLIAVMSLAAVFYWL